MDLIELLKNQISPSVMEQFQRESNASPEQTEVAVGGILSSILGGLQQNSSTPQGAAALNNALEQDHNGGLLNNLLSVLQGGSVEPQYERAANGAGIIGHIFGANTGTIVDGISKATGIDTSNIGSMLIKLAPVVMGVLGMVKSKGGLDTQQVTGVLNNTVQENKSQNPLFAMVGKVLDQDGDGSFVDDLGNIGMNVLGSLFKR